MVRLVDEKELIQIYPKVFNHSNISAMKKQGVIPVVKMPNRRYFYNLDSIEAWLHELEQK